MGCRKLFGVGRNTAADRRLWSAGPPDSGVTPAPGPTKPRPPIRRSNSLRSSRRSSGHPAFQRKKGSFHLELDPWSSPLTRKGVSLQQLQYEEHFGRRQSLISLEKGTADRRLVQVLDRSQRLPRRTSVTHMQSGGCRTQPQHQVQQQPASMMYLDMENGQVWQELLPNKRDRDSASDDPGTPTSTDNNDSTITSTAGAVSNPTLSPSGLGPPKRPLVKQASQNGGFNGKSDGASTPVLRYGQAKIIQGRPRKRVVFKNGTVNLSKEHVSKRSQRYLQDIFTTLVDIQWRWNLLVFAMGFILSWLGFALIWWLISFAHGDFEHLDDADWSPCMVNVRSFASAFLFSIETQHTIGYGSRYTTEECPEAIFVMCLQSITGLMIQCFMVGIVFAKISRPKKRSQTLMFSRHAIVCLRDGRLSLMFRVGDVRKSHIIGAKVSAQVIRRKQTAEGECIPYYHHELDVHFDAGGDNVLLIWPAIIVHEVDSRSPFYGMRAEDMVRDRYELVAILEGTIESTGQSIQARTSYLPTEILWGHRFEQLISYRKDNGDYMVDYSKFNYTYEVETPLCSARDYYEYQRALQLSGTVRPGVVQSPSLGGVSLDSLRRSDISTALAASTQRSESPRTEEHQQLIPYGGTLA